MKKIYIQPLTLVELAQCEMLIAASSLNITNGDSQSIEISDDEHNDEFAVKGYSFGDDF